MKPSEMIPLFIPLRTEWFRAYESGDKQHEWRAYGPKWNEKTLIEGRRAILAHGYTRERLSRRIGKWWKVPRDHAPKGAQLMFPNKAFMVKIEIVT